MATLNLGRIKPVFQGAYSGSTAYVVDDIVTFGDETFICIQASTGNATSNASYWTKLAAKGADGTDLGTTLTTTLLTGESEHVYKINVFRVTNVTDSDATVTADIEKSGTHKKICNELTVPANSSVDIIDKTNSFYLEETDLIRGGASAILATMIYAMPPIIRLTNAGIRQVSDQIIESATPLG